MYIMFSGRYGIFLDLKGWFTQKWKFFHPYAIYILKSH